ncbi:MAG: hypothetical protein HY013_03440 [Candidatus Solibacter usitatus]|nr:hypothetical protein [Candidatus Solibacter usitatus]
MIGWLLALCALPLFAQKTHTLCAACHADQVAAFQTHKHFSKGLSCDACHGASTQHRNSTGAVAPDRVAAPEEVPALCGGCHAAEKSEYAASRHGQLVLAKSRTRAAHCGTCHGVHNLRTAVQMRQQCNKCHATLAESHPRVAAEASCFTCHAKHTLKGARG